MEGGGRLLFLYCMAAQQPSFYQHHFPNILYIIWFGWFPPMRGHAQKRA